MNKRSLDYLAITSSHKISQVIGKKVKNGKIVQGRDVETLTTKALGVLQSQGVYAMALFLFSRSGKETEETKMSVEERIAVGMLSWLWPLRKPAEALKTLQEKDKLQTDKGIDQVNSSKTEMLHAWANLSSDLDTLLLVRDLYEQTLIYARYHAKALGGKR